MSPRTVGPRSGSYEVRKTRSRVKVWPSMLASMYASPGKSGLLTRLGLEMNQHGLAYSCSRDYP